MENPEGRDQKRRPKCRHGRIGARLMATPDETLRAALRGAREAADILPALARVEYRRAHRDEDCPASMIPTMQDMAGWLTPVRLDGDGAIRLPPCPDAARKDASAALCTVFRLEWPAGKAPKRPHGSWLAMTWGGKQTLSAMVLGDTLSPEGVLSGSLDYVHGLWLALSAAERAPHPLAAIMRAWQERPREIEADTRATAILPSDLFAWAGGRAPSILEAPLNDNELPIQPGLVEPNRAPFLPGLEPPDSAVVPAPALVVAEEIGFGDLTSGRGARIDKRLLVYSLLSVPRDARRPGGRYTLRPSLRTLAHEWIWPAPLNTGTGEGERSLWKPSRHARLLARAMNAVTLAGVILPDRREWRPVMFRARPDFGDLDSCAVIEIALPDAADHGPLIRRDALIAAGVVSDPAFDGSLALATLWDRAKAANGGYRIYATRPKALRDPDGYLLAALRGADGKPVLDENGEPVAAGRITGHGNNPFPGRNGRLQWRKGEVPQRDWRHPDAVILGQERHPHADKVPILDRYDRRRLFYGHASDQMEKRQRSKAADRADSRLRTLEADGRVVIEDCGPDGWRVLETLPHALEE